VFYYLFVILYLCFFGNAVNFTDGLDRSGLRNDPDRVAHARAVAAFGSPALGVPAFYGALAGACAGFLWFNAHPARVFMGDTGSLALGMGLAAAAIVISRSVATHRRRGLRCRNLFHDDPAVRVQVSPHQARHRVRQSQPCLSTGARSTIISRSWAGKKHRSWRDFTSRR
jgi:hypothetical protein